MVMRRNFHLQLRRIREMGRSGTTKVDIHLHALREGRTYVRSTIFTVIRRETVIKSVQIGRREEMGCN